MSYDITLYPRQPGQDWDEVIAADELDGPAMDEAQLAAGVSTFRRIEARLREQLTEPVEVWVAEETDGDVLGELTGTESGLQVELYDRSASVSFPAADRPDREAFHRLVRKAVRIVAEETGYEAYDPQLRAPSDGTIDETQAGESGSGDGLATAGGLAGGATAVGATVALRPQPLISSSASPSSSSLSAARVHICMALTLPPRPLALICAARYGSR